MTLVHPSSLNPPTGNIVTLYLMQQALLVDFADGQQRKIIIILDEISMEFWKVIQPNKWEERRIEMELPILLKALYNTVTLGNEFSKKESLQT